MLAPVAVQSCQACGGLVFWLEHVVTGKRAPINADPDPRGNIVLELTNFGWRYRVLRKNETAPEDGLWMSHFVTCVKAADFRRPRLPQRPAPRPLPDNIVPLLRPPHTSQHREGE